MRRFATCTVGLNHWTARRGRGAWATPAWSLRTAAPYAPIGERLELAAYRFATSEPSQWGDAFLMRLTASIRFSMELA